MTNAKNLIRAFRQGIVQEGGNCASIAIIKAAIDTFGIGKVFEHEQTPDGYNVTLRDETKLSFSNAELRETKERAAFHLRTGENNDETGLFQEIYDYANFCFCVMVKRVMEIGESEDGVGDFQDAISALNDGAATRHLPGVLGLSATKPRFGGRTSGQPGFIAWSGPHTVFASHGVYDHWGDVRRLTIRYPMRMQILAH